MKLLLKMFVKNYQNYNDNKVRSGYIKISGILGIILNICLFIMKIIVGILFNSIAVCADALNSLTDAFSSVISLVSAIFAEKPADSEHPYGHERIEYLGSLFVSFIVMLFGLSLIKESITKIIHPEVLTFSWITIIILVISIGVKLYMYYYNNHYGKLIDASILKATAIDSLGDCLSMSAIIIAMLIYYFTNINLDGLMGLVVACIILKNGYDILKDTVNELVGTAPDPDYVKEITREIKSYPGVLGVHDCIIHSYGPNRTFISAHVEVDSKDSIQKSHDLVDNIEKDFNNKKHLSLVLHMDPIDIDDPFTNKMRAIVEKIVVDIDSGLSIHDFRVVKGETHNNLIFDVVIPYNCDKSVAEVLTTIRKRIPNDGDKENFAIMGVDRY